jgi:hypothetical protein
MSGDSGAWVVDYLTGELYGHLIASDVFGVAYVIPINDIFQDIQLRLSLEGVKLPASHQSLAGKAEDVIKVPVRKKILGYEYELGDRMLGSKVSSWIRRLWRRHPSPDASRSDSGYSSMNSTPQRSPPESPLYPGSKIQGREG